MSKEKPALKTTIKSQFSAEAIAAGGGIIGLLTLSLLIYQNYLMSDHTAEMIETNKEMIYQRKMQEKERYNHLIEILYDHKEGSTVNKTSYKREVRTARYNAKLRTEAFRESVEYLKRIDRDLDFTGGLLGEKINLTGKDLYSINCQGADLRESNLSEVIAKKSNFSDCDFFYANLTGADFTESNFQKTILGKANLSKSNLTNADLSQATLWDTNLDQANMSGVNLCGASLRNVDLSNVDLSNAIYDRNTAWPENFDLIAADLKFKMKLVNSKD